MTVLLKNYSFPFFTVFILIIGLLNYKETLPPQKDTLVIRKTSDFEISGDGRAKEWDQTNWIEIPQRTSTGEKLLTKAKALYSKDGLYFLFHCEDNILSSTMEADFLDLWNEDVIEVFLWPDESTPTYFEYEISPLNYELPILIYNDGGELLSWQPFHYKDVRKTRHATSAEGGEKKSKATVDSWSVEFFIPFKLLRPLNNIPPKSGSKWKGNLYRIDYDTGEELWSWQLTSGDFHEYKKFGTFLFE